MKPQTHIDFSKILERLGDAVFIKDKTRRYIFVNKAAARMMGKKKSQIIGKTAEQIFNKADAKTIHAVDNENFKGRTVNKVRELKVGKSEIFLHTVQNPIKDWEGNIIGVSGIVRDVTRTYEQQEKTKQAKQEAEQYLEISGTMTMAFNTKGKVTMINKKGCRILGYKKDEIIGKDWFDTFLPKKHAKEIKGVFKKILAGNLKLTEFYENPILRKDGSERLIAWHNAFIKDKKGKITGVLSSGEDITDTKEIEEKILQEKSFSEAVMNSLPGIFYVFDTQGKFIAWNENFKNIGGYSDDDVAKSSALDYFTEQDKPLVGKKVKEVFQKGKAAVEATFVTKNGKEIPFHLTGQLMLKDGQPYLIGMGIDISKQKEAQRKLLVSEEKYRLLYETSSDAVMTLEPPSWKFTSGNPAIIKIFGVKNEKKFTSLPPWKLSPKYQPDGQLSSTKAKTMIETAMKKGMHFFEWTHKKLNGPDFFATVLLNRVDTGNKSFLQARVTDITEKRIAEKQILEAKERFEDVAKISGDWIWETDIQGKFTYSSGITKKLIGYSQKELLKKRPYDFMDDNEAARVLALFNKHRKTKKPVIGLESWQTTRDGKDIYLLINAIPIIHEKKCVGFRGVCKDITQKKLEEEHKKEDAKSYELLSNIGMELNAPESFSETISGVAEKLGNEYGLDRVVGFILNENEKKAHREFSWAKADNCVMKSNELDLSGTPSFVKMLKEKGMILADDIRTLPNDSYILLKSKKVKSILSVPIKPFKATTGFICFHSIDNYRHWTTQEVRMIKIIANMLGQAMERQFTRQETEREREKLHKTLYNIGDAVFAIDANLKVTHFNKVAAEITGVAPKEIIGKPYDSKLRFVHADNEEKIDQFILDVFATGKAQKMHDKTVLIDTKGNKKPIADSAAPLIDSEGNVTGCVVVFRDITLQQEIDRMKTEFVSVASHQLRTPLGGIKWFTELLATESLGALNKKQKDAIQNITESNERMITLVQDLLNVSRMEKGKALVVKRKRTDLCGIIMSVVQENTLLAKTKGIQITLPAQCKGSRQLIVNVDAKRIEQVIHNLFNNAIKYSKAKGKVSIELKKTKKEITFSVKDSGVGIPKNQQKRIFEKFFRADNVITIQTDGTGLGLYIAKTIVEAHGGRIWFESESKKGTTFFFTIPK